jgi:hypothetical protein
MKAEPCGQGSQVPQHALVGDGLAGARVGESVQQGELERWDDAHTSMAGAPKNRTSPLFVAERASAP